MESGPLGDTDQQLWRGHVASSVPGVQFDAAWLVTWWAERTETRHPEPRALAVDAMYQRAVELAAVAPPDERVVRDRLAAELGKQLRVERTSMWVSASAVEVALSPAAAEAVARHRSRTAEMAEIAHLRETVFADLTTAVLWWLQRNDFRVDEVRSARGILEEIVELVRGVDDVHWSEKLTAALVEATPDLDVHDRHGLNRQIRKVLGFYVDPLAS
ncbi:hypothetical protein FKR81_22200 [Lentzea tibetensis]|uniref:Uncharacterized protein n=1 Tax=Lentzea tibetensis TaxID=2591470 RepID=A0A563EQM0_9PSEU|nr:hypothetical protein [Lentzea tibetensis]TWP49950.1 hypothetical protein FKR81_22200 [Lentzea tibetensis]